MNITELRILTAQGKIHYNPELDSFTCEGVLVTDSHDHNLCVMALGVGAPRIDPEPPAPEEPAPPRLVPTPKPAPPDAPVAPASPTQEAP